MSQPRILRLGRQREHVLFGSRFWCDSRRTGFIIAHGTPEQGNGITVTITVLLQLYHNRKVVKVDALLKASELGDLYACVTVCMQRVLSSAKLRIR